MIPKFYLILLVFGLITACEKNGNEPADVPLPEIETLSADGISVTEATLRGKLISENVSGNILAGFYYGKESGLNTCDSVFSSLDGDSLFAENLEDMDAGARYYYKAVVKLDDKIYTGNEIYFDTQSGVVELQLISTGNFTPSSFVATGEVVERNGADITELGLCYCKEPVPDISDSTKNVSPDSVSFTIKLDELISGQTYYLRAYAKTAMNVYYSDEKEVQLNYFMDERDGHIYKYVNIGNQTWMAENLAYLPQVCEISQDCGYYVYNYVGSDTSEAKAAKSYNDYGVLYSFAEAKNVCPTGWHLPSDNEWQTLIDHASYNNYRYKEALALKALEGWNGEGNGEDPWGFNAKPAGMKDYISQEFINQGSVTIFWSSVPNVGEGAYSLKLVDDKDDIKAFYAYMKDACSVRCLKDE